MAPQPYTSHSPSSSTPSPLARLPSPSLFPLPLSPIPFPDHSPSSSADSPPSSLFAFGHVYGLWDANCGSFVGVRSTSRSIHGEGGRGSSNWEKKEEKREKEGVDRRVKGEEYNSDALIVKTGENENHFLKRGSTEEKGRGFHYWSEEEKEDDGNGEEEEEEERKRRLSFRASAVDAWSWLRTEMSLGEMAESSLRPFRVSLVRWQDKRWRREGNRERREREKGQEGEIHRSGATPPLLSFRPYDSFRLHQTEGGRRGRRSEGRGRKEERAETGGAEGERGVAEGERREREEETSESYFEFFLSHREAERRLSFLRCHPLFPPSLSLSSSTPLFPKSLRPLFIPPSLLLSRALSLLKKSRELVGGRRRGTKEEEEGKRGERRTSKLPLFPFFSPPLSPARSRSLCVVPCELSELISASENEREESIDQERIDGEKERKKEGSGDREDKRTIVQDHVREAREQSPFSRFLLVPSREQLKEAEKEMRRGEKKEGRDKTKGREKKREKGESDKDLAEGEQGTRRKETEAEDSSPSSSLPSRLPPPPLPCLAFDPRSLVLRDDAPLFFSPSLSVTLTLNQHRQSEGEGTGEKGEKQTVGVAKISPLFLLKSHLDRCLSLSLSLLFSHLVRVRVEERHKRFHAERKRRKEREEEKRREEETKKRTEKMERESSTAERRKSSDVDSPFFRPLSSLFSSLFPGRERKREKDGEKKPGTGEGEDEDESRRREILWRRKKPIERKGERKREEGDEEEEEEDLLGDSSNEYGDPMDFMDDSLLPDPVEVLSMVGFKDIISALSSTAGLNPNRPFKVVFQGFNLPRPRPVSEVWEEFQVFAQDTRDRVVLGTEWGRRYLLRVRVDHGIEVQSLRKRILHQPELDRAEALTLLEAVEKERGKKEVCEESNTKGNETDIGPNSELDRSSSSSSSLLSASPTFYLSPSDPLSQLFKGGNVSTPPPSSSHDSPVASSPSLSVSSPHTLVDILSPLRFGPTLRSPRLLLFLEINMLGEARESKSEGARVEEGGTAGIEQKGVGKKRGKKGKEKQESEGGDVSQCLSKDAEKGRDGEGGREEGEEVGREQEAERDRRDKVRVRAKENNGINSFASSAAASPLAPPPPSPPFPSRPPSPLASPSVQTSMTIVIGNVDIASFIHFFSSSPSSSPPFFPPLDGGGEGISFQQAQIACLL